MALLMHYAAKRGFLIFLFVQGCLGIQAKIGKSLFASMDEGADGKCAPLKNYGTFHTAEVTVGKPGQSFDMIADTGSNSLIVPTCFCNKQGSCTDDNRCFKAPESSTFHVSTPQIPLVIRFGSGTVLTFAASDVVRVGPVSTNMTEGMLMMTDKAMDFNGMFEGILGLGLPFNMTVPEKNIIGGFMSKIAVDTGDAVTKQNFTQVLHAEPPGFIEQAGITTFSMCFNGASDGVLGYDEKPSDVALGSIGTYHWGVDFRGITIGNASAPIEICQSMAAGQSSPCGMIPDSGTTLITAPEEHVEILLAGICDGWSRCQQKYASVLAAASAASRVPFSKRVTLELLLLDCHEWLSEENGGLNELPALEFHLRGHDGRNQTISLPGWAYIIELIVLGPNSTLQTCAPAISVMNYITANNGPIWILGTPLFYQYRLQFNMKAEPPSIAFTELTKDAPCGSCGGKNLSLVTAENYAKQPRRVDGSPRMPSIDISKPL